MGRKKHDNWTWETIVKSKKLIKEKGNKRIFKVNSEKHHIKNKDTDEEVTGKIHKFFNYILVDKKEGLLSSSDDLGYLIKRLER